MSFQAPLKTSPVLSPLVTPTLASPQKLQSSPLTSPAGSKASMGQSDATLLIKSKDISSAAPETAGRSDSRGISTRIELGGGHRNAKMQKEIPSPTARIDIDSMDMGSLVKRSEESAISRKERLLSAQEKHPRSMTGRGELTLTGETYFNSHGNFSVTCKHLGFCSGAFDVSVLMAYSIVSLGEWCQCFETVFSSHLQGLKYPERNSSLDVFWFLHEPAEAGNYICTL